MRAITFGNFLRTARASILGFLLVTSAAKVNGEVDKLNNGKNTAAEKQSKIATNFSRECPAVVLGRLPESLIRICRVSNYEVDQVLSEIVICPVISFRL